MGFGRVFIFIFVFALLEAMVLARAAAWIGWVPTILATVVTAMLGSYLFRREGLETWQRLQLKMSQGEAPGVELLEGVMLLMGGALLITPGFLTDGIGFLMLLPQSRGAMARYLVSKGLTQGMAGASRSGFYYQHRSYQAGPGPSGFRAGPQSGNPSDSQPRVYDDGRGHVIIEGQAEEKD